MCLKTLVIFNSEIKNTTNIGMEGRALMLTEKIKTIILSTSKSQLLRKTRSLLKSMKIPNKNLKSLEPLN